MCTGAELLISKVASLISKAWKVVKKYLVYIIVIVAVFYPFLFPMISSFLGPTLAAIFTPAAGSIWAAGAFSWQAFALRAMVGLAIGYLLDSETASDIVEGVARVTKETVEKVAEIVGDAAGSLLGSFFSSPFGIALAVAAGVYFFGSGKRDDATGNSEKENRDSDDPRADVYGAVEDSEEEIEVKDESLYAPGLPVAVGF